MTFPRDNDINYVPLRHPKQSFGLDNHVIIMYLNENYHKKIIDDQRRKARNCYTCFGTIFIVIGILICIKSVMVGIICIIIGGLITYFGRKITLNMNSNTEPIGYSYYYYDINDQNVKFIIVSNNGNIITSEYGIKSHLGHINDIRQIKYYSNGSDISFIALKKYNANKGQRFQRDMAIFYKKKEFCAVLTNRIRQIKDYGLNSIQLDYQKMYGLTKMEQIIDEPVTVIEIEPQNNNDIGCEINYEKPPAYNPNISEDNIVTETEGDITNQ